MTTLFPPPRLLLRWEEQLVPSLRHVRLPAGVTCGGSHTNPTLLSSPVPLQGP